MPPRSLFPTSAAATVQIAGRHLYLIFDTKLASQIYRKPKLFIFDPFTLMVWTLVGASKGDLEILKMGAQTVRKDPKVKDDGRRILYDLHSMTAPHFSGDSLEKLTSFFIDALCDDIDNRFSPDKESSYEWHTVDLCEFVKHTWTYASITGLFGSHIYSIWPQVGTWLWDFDRHFQKIIMKMPRFMAPKAYALRDEGKAMCELWEREALKAEVDGKVGGDCAWDPYWGLRYTRERVKYLMKQGISTQGRAGNMMSFIWGVSNPRQPQNGL
jgi:ATP-binding cassette subfamily D (ALD) long-chain fatty acid import protein